MDAHEIPDPIQWHEGLMLTPQHFQQLTLRQEALWQYVSKTVAPFYWGVRRLKIDPSSLVSGTFKVIELEAVMPDSLVVSVGQRGDSELSVDLTPFKSQMVGRPVPVHLAVPARETDSLTKGDLPRYKSVDGQPVFNEETGEQVLIPRLRPRLSLEVSERPTRKFVSFPLARVVYRDEAFALADDYIPPRLSMSKETELSGMCLLAAKGLREKAVFLADQMEGGGERAALKNETLLRSLVAHLPPLEAMLDAGVSHPFEVYLALCSVLGHLSVMGWSPLPPLLSPYDHNDLRATFREVLQHISRKIEEGITASFTVHPFKYADEVYSIDFEDEWVTKRLAIGIRGQAGMSEQDVIRWGRECLIGSRRRMRSLRETRTMGVRRELIERDGDLVPPRGVVLFSLRPDRENVEPEEPLQIFNPGLPRPSEIVLYVRSAPARSKV